MTYSNASLPDDIDALKALLLARETTLRERDSDLENLRDTVATLGVDPVIQDTQTPLS
ncbi:hypothetical protein [Ralstonia sp. 25mfcol4.1]|uniref:hypothetical protein n=1 Tax=Ralstonia sp. 25mfcol4.1 TaxID=1761899 RepID=UPI001587DC95|nr:hypothetical protein [Ralstonia sp. 25mfcol4.1]